jgi:hypothetical protein
MRGQFAHRLMLATLVLCQISVCLAANTPDPNDSTKHREAVCVGEMER